MRSAKEHADQDLHTDHMEETTHTAFVRDLLELALRLTELSATQGGQKTLDRVARGEMGKNRTPNRFQWGARNREAEEG